MWINKHNKNYMKKCVGDKCRGGLFLCIMKNTILFKYGQYVPRYMCV